MNETPRSSKFVAVGASVGASVGLLVLAGAARGAADPPPTPVVAQQHVTAPSLPGEKNKEGVVKPGGGLKTDQYGNLIQPVGPPPASSPAAPPPAQAPKGADPKAKAGGPAPAVPAAPPAPAPSGPGVATGPNIVHIRGVVKSYEPGKTLTMTLPRAGTTVTYTLKAGAEVPEGLKPGDPVRIRVQAAEKGKIVDKVERRSQP